MSDTTNTNGSAEAKKPTRVAELLKAHKEADKRPTKDETKKLLTEFKKGLEARDAARAALKAAEEAMSKNAEAMVMAFGDKKIDVGGRLFFPSSRGDAVFYRELGSQDPDSIIKA